MSLTARPLLPDLRLRELTPDDADAGAALARSRGWSFEPERWRYMLAVGGGWGAVDPTGALVGTVQLTSCTPDVAAVGSMLVSAGLERRGLGRMLLRRALDAAGDRLVTLFATRQGRPLYERLGFRCVGELVMYGGVLDPGEGSGGSPRDRVRSRPAAPGDLRGMSALDAVAHGGERTPLIAALPGFVRSIRVVDEPAVGGAFRAFGAAWPSEGRTVVGPLLAVDGASAVAVLDGLAADLPGRVRVDVRSGPGADGGDEVRAWLAGHGFERVGATTVMVRGPRDLPGRAGLIHAPIMQSLT